ncbi:MAG: hypothetical protein PHV43_02630 [Candidatus Colwellbacteria bacterium]|nr:hypothetical protein [Candidatus Colwellbacteria bacterium]
MLGTFDANDLPFVQIEVWGVNGTPKTLNALVDSGYNSYLQITFVDAVPLGLVLEGVQPKTLADGSSKSNLVCRGMVKLDNKEVATTIDITFGGKTLIGTRLLKELNKIFILDCTSGKVEIKDNKLPQNGDKE